MVQRSSYEATLQTSLRAAWQLDNVIGPEAELDFGRNFLPDALARTAELSSLAPDEQRLLNQINAHQYLRLFVIVEEFILPALFDHSRTLVGRDPVGIRAMINFAGEEAKHMHMFERFESAFNRQFPVECRMIGPSDAIVAEVLRHQPLAVALTILMFEWMTQVHYVGSIRDAGDLEPLFKSMLKHHWIEESQHAKLDTLLIDSLAAGLDEQAIDAGIGEYVEILGFFDGGLKAQAGLNLDALERALGRSLDDRPALEAQQHQAARWTYLSSGMTHPTFVETLEELAPAGAARVAEAARAFS